MCQLRTSLNMAPRAFETPRDNTQQHTPLQHRDRALTNIYPHEGLARPWILLRPHSITGAQRSQKIPGI